MRTDHFRGVTRHCVMCANPIPAERKWDAVTCSPECTKARKQYGRSRLDQTRCRYCLKPSTPEERARFNLWQKWEAEMMDTNPELAAAVKAKWEAKAMTDPTLAAKVLDRALLREVQGLRLKLSRSTNPEEAEVSEPQDEDDDAVGSVASEVEE